ncbi:hypothetical protein DL93DRAFT_1511378 [Clavulina sp. PMI_390]|nr:hypothetical protein DL93DRAFT_1511378 [Clavulina sp. PMI_390]
MPRRMSSKMRRLRCGAAMCCLQTPRAYRISARSCLINTKASQHLWPGTTIADARAIARTARIRTLLSGAVVFHHPPPSAPPNLSCCHHQTMAPLALLRNHRCCHAGRHPQHCWHEVRDAHPYYFDIGFLFIATPPNLAV